MCLPFNFARAWGRNVLTQQLNCNLSSSFPFQLANSPVSGTVTVDIPGWRELSLCVRVEAILTQQRSVSASGNHRAIMPTSLHD